MFVTKWQIKCETVKLLETIDLNSLPQQWFDSTFKFMLPMSPIWLKKSTKIIIVPSVYAEQGAST